MDNLEAVRDAALRAGVEFGDFRTFRREGTSVTLQDGRADKMARELEYGTAVRVLLGGAWGFASVNSAERRDIENALDAALKMAKSAAVSVRDPGKVARVDPIRGSFSIGAEVEPDSVPLQRKALFLKALEADARKTAGAFAANTVFSYHDEICTEKVVNTFGTALENSACRTSVLCSVTVKDGPARQNGFEMRGGVGGWEIAESVRSAEFGVRAAEVALSLLKAESAPPGTYPVVLDGKLAGIFVHEAFGHSSEADSVLSGKSIVAGKVGTRIGSPLVTIVDDATLATGNGRYLFDSEGVAASRRVLVENGTMKSLLHSLETAGRMGEKPTGSARAMDHQSPPIVRMSNTFFAPGRSSFEGLLRPIDLGVYLKGSHSGYVKTDQGRFHVAARQAWMIRKGELAEPLRDVSISGLTLETLKKIDAVGNDFSMGSAGGSCGKAGQSIPVDEGGPSIRVSEIVVGGRSGARSS